MSHRPTELDEMTGKQVLAFIVFTPIFIAVASSFHGSGAKTLPDKAATASVAPVRAVQSAKGPSAADKAKFEALLKDASR